LERESLKKPFNFEKSVKTSQLKQWRKTKYLAMQAKETFGGGSNVKSNDDDGYRSLVPFSVGFLEQEQENQLTKPPPLPLL
jgi:hypothetical protein